MALIAWYPLNGDILDYSGNNLISTVTTTPNYDNSGKIGKCMTTGAFTVPSGTLNKNTQSICFWYYNTEPTPSTTGSHQISGGAVRYYGMYAYPNNDDFHYTFYDESTGTNAISGVVTDVLKCREWTHICLINDNLSFSIYINGELTRIFSATSWTRNFNSTPYQLVHNSPYHKLNDFRIYNHALSSKEISEIYKTKILHYTFDDFAESTTNLWTGNLVIYNNYGVPATLTNTGQTYMGQPVYRLGMTVDTTKSSYLSHFQSALYSHGVYGGTTTFKANTKYSASIYWKPVNKSDVLVGGTASNISGWSALPKESIGDGWFRHTQVRHGNVTEDKRDNVFHSFICPSMQLNETVYIDFTCPQIEEGKNYSTPYVNGTRSDNVWDKSGFGNDSTLGLTTTPTWTEDSKIGRGAYEFDGSNKWILIPNSQGKIVDRITVSAWAYRDNWNTSTSERVISCTESGGWQIGYNDSAGYVSFPCYIASVGYKIPMVARGEFTSGWHHLVGVFDGVNLKLYVDGILKDSVAAGGSTIGYNSTNSIFIGAEATSSPTIPTGGYWNGLIDDVRIYATALSDEDIRELYETRMSVSDKGDLFVNGLDVPQSTNLVVNGHQDMESNYNFSQFEYNGPNHCFTRTSGSATVSSDMYIPINKEHTFKLSGEFKDGNGIPSRYYFGFHCYDKDFNEIVHDMVTFYSNTTTTLAQPLKNGDTTVTLTSSLNWKSDLAGSYAHYKCIGFWGSKSDYPDYTYTRTTAHYLTVNGNTLVLRYPWNGGNVPSGTPVANMYSGATYMYSGATNLLATSDWTYRESGSISGWGQNSYTTWRYGTEYVKLMFLINRDANGTPSTWVRNLKLENTTFNQNVLHSEAKISLSANGLIKGKRISDSSMPVRYIRDHINGSTANTSNHWVQIQAIDDIGRNLALFRPSSGVERPYPSTAPLTLITDGNTATTPYIHGDYALVDLGKVHDIKEVKVWHYWGDGRTYYDTKTEVSEDGENWITIFDSAIEGTYPETAQGHTIQCKPQLFSMREDGTIYARNIYSGY